MSHAIDMRGTHGAWRVLERVAASASAGNGVKWKAICGTCSRLQVISGKALRRGSQRCRDCSNAANYFHVAPAPHPCGICQTPTTRPVYCSEVCCAESNRRRAREHWRSLGAKPRQPKRVSISPRERRALEDARYDAL